MCLGAIYGASLARYYFSSTRSGTARISFNDSLIYEEMAKHLEKRTIPGIRLLAEEAAGASNEWEPCQSKVFY